LNTPPLEWDDTMGWTGQCEPEVCGPAPQPAHATAVLGEEALQELVYPEPALFLCDVGYHVEFWEPPFPDQPTPPDRHMYVRSSGTRCTNDEVDNIGVNSTAGEAECEALCDANATCAAFELTCDGRCILLASCAEQAPSDCGTQLLTKRALPTSTLVEMSCVAGGRVVNTTGSRCMPICGDGQLVPVDHLPLTSRLEQCDDGNSVNGDGCSADCQVEAGFVCTGGHAGGPDACTVAEVHAEGSAWLVLSGARAAADEELRLAAEIALSRTLGCPLRDLEVWQVLSLAADDPDASRFHRVRQEVSVHFRVKISDYNALSIGEVEGALLAQSFLPKLSVAFTDHTTLRDLYVEVVEVAPPEVVGDRWNFWTHGVSLSDTIWELSLYVGPVLLYLAVLLFVAPVARWFLIIRKRKNRLTGRLDDVSEEFIGQWAVNICGWIDAKLTCCSLLCCLPARLADTWDSMGLMPYWTGVRKAWCCCLCYLSGFGFCGACLPGSQRSEIRDFFGFGDKVKGNIELSDYCCYLCCPICCVIQEAQHVDRAMKVLPPPFQKEADFAFGTLGRDGDQEAGAVAAEAAPKEVAAPRGMIMDNDA